MAQIRINTVSKSHNASFRVTLTELNRSTYTRQKRNHRIVIRLFSTVTPNIPLYIEPVHTNSHAIKTKKSTTHRRRPLPRVSRRPLEKSVRHVGAASRNQRAARQSRKASLAGLSTISLSHATFPSLSLFLSLSLVPLSLSPFRDASFSLSPLSLFLATSFLYLPGVLLPSADPGFPFTRNPFLSARCSTADDNPFSMNDLLHSPANPVPFPAESLQSGTNIHRVYRALSLSPLGRSSATICTTVQECTQLRE